MAERNVSLVAVLCGLALVMTPPLSSGAAFAQDKARRLFISGHSLTDRPMPDMIAAMAEQAGRPIVWERQHIGGSTIKRRSAGADGTPAGSGYGAGTDRDGRPIDMADAFKAEGGYDTLLITEWHRVLDALEREGTVRHLREVQDRFIQANPSGTTYFYAPWADLADHRKPQGWIAFERRASPVWQCVVRRVNDGLARQSRRDRILFVPASLGLAELVAELTAPAGAPGFETLAAQEVIALLFTDNVHLTELGTYFVALVTYGSVFEADIRAAWAPASLDPIRAATLRAVAARFLERWKAEGGLPAKADCNAVTLDFIPGYTAYMRDTYGVPEVGYLRASLRRIRDRIRMTWTLRGI
jgi:hypothetical protein